MMKKTLVLALFLLTMMGMSAQQPSIIERVLINSVEEKVSSMQQFIGFDDRQAQKLRKMELDFLLEVNKAEHCILCNKQKRIENLKQKRDAELQKILERDQYLKYQSLEDDLLNKNNRLWFEGEK